MNYYLYKQSIYLYSIYISPPFDGSLPRKSLQRQNKVVSVNINMKL